jgi:hypothetical protein
VHDFDLIVNAKRCKAFSAYRDAVTNKL